ncbi:hypothetical protein CL635_01985 [bacterium]|nr:hypothetical protein [bacterium]|tara:strand:- start:2947 stop:3894 length:948 start_codon:yes stop_codon:yes gene_type:complete
MKITRSQAKDVCKKFQCDYIGHRFLASGNHNQCFLLKTAQRNCVIKIEMNPGYVTKEYSNLSFLKKGLGPEIYLFDDSKSVLPEAYMVMEFLTGKHPSRKATNGFVRGMAGWLRKLHQIKSSNIPTSERKLIQSLHYWGSHHYKRFNGDKRFIEHPFRQELEVAFERSLELCKENTSLFARRRHFPLVHNDLYRGNVFVNGNKICIVDWEFAGFGLHERDLINFFYSYTLTDVQKKLFLRTYGYADTKIARKKLRMISLMLSLGGFEYLVNRVCLIEKGKIDKKQRASRSKPLISKLRKHLTKHNKLVREINQFE